jgi:PilZ domain-containing protein
MPTVRDSQLDMSQPATQDNSGESFPDRRRYPRYRFGALITVRPPGGGAIPAMTLEINESGLSALVGATLKVGDRLELEPIAGGRTSAIVRRTVGRVSGFEFLDLSPEQAQDIRDRCKRLPLFRGEKLGL